MTEAIETWQKEVRTRYGEQWKVWAEAKDTTFDCAPTKSSQVGSSFIGCKISGRPCLVNNRPLSAQKRSSQIRAQPPDDDLGVEPAEQKRFDKLKGFSQFSAQPDDDLGVEIPRCYAVLHIAGEERPSRAKAQRAAENAWLGKVRYDYGERYTDLNYAEDTNTVCAPSSTTSLLKRVFFRCNISARPCQVPSERLEQIPNLQQEND